MACATSLSVLLMLAAYAAGQGFRASEDRIVGVTDSNAQLKALYSNSKSWRRSYKAAPSTACSNARSSSLCAAAAVGSMDAYAQLMVATSPAIYSSIDPGNTGPVRLVAAPLDQQGCDTCSAFAIAAAAETAMASALHVEVTECSISVQALHFCPPSKQPGRSCSGGYTLSSTFALLQQTIGALPTDACLPYKPDIRGELSQADICTGKCNAPSTYAGQGSFSSSQITSMWQAQRHIRLHGAVVSRFDIYADFKPFFANYGNAKAIYKPKSGAKFVGGHAVVLVGYDNEQQFWLVRNSWGTNWADGGFFRVAYGTCSVLTPETGEAYGLVWTPQKQPDATKLKVTPGLRAGCYLYKAGPFDYLSKVAALAKIPLEEFMLDNTAYVKDLDVPIQGTQLLLCNPQSETIIVDTAAAPAPVLPQKPTDSNPQTPAAPSKAGRIADTQLEALLAIKASADQHGSKVMQGWSRQSGANGGYCKWKGISDSFFSAVNLNCSSDYLVKGLFLQNQGLLGTIPKQIADLTQLRYLDLERNNFTGQLPETLSKLPLTDLWLQDNKLSGTIPASWRPLTDSLERLALSGNQLTGPLPEWLGDCREMWWISLTDNMFQGTIPASWRSLHYLDHGQTFFWVAIRG